MHMYTDYIQYTYIANSLVKYPSRYLYKHCIIYVLFIYIDYINFNDLLIKIFDNSIFCISYCVLVIVNASLIYSNFKKTLAFIINLTYNNNRTIPR